MTLPRDVVPGRFYMITRRCTQRQFLLRPDDETNNAFIYCLAEAAARFGIEVILPCAMSNHKHEVLYDRYGRVPEFTEHFHKMLAKCMNALRGRWENFWATEQVCMVELVDRADVMSKLVYTATNPVKDGLVEKVSDWPGVNGLYPLLNGEPLRARRPRYYFREDGPMPEKLELELVIPPELGDKQEILDELREKVAAAEAAYAAERRSTGARVLGRRAVLAQSWRSFPKSHAPRRNLRPRIAARSKWSRLEAIRRNRAFVVAYELARALWVAGQEVVFPLGTYWLRRFCKVRVDPDPLVN